MGEYDKDLKELNDEFYNFLQEDIENSIKNYDVDNLKKALVNWKNDYEISEKALTNWILNANKRKKELLQTKSNGKTVVTENYKKAIQNRQNKNKIVGYENCLKRGYAILQTLNHTLANSDTEYDVLFKVNEDTMTEKIYTMKEMLNVISFDSAVILKELNKKLKDAEYQISNITANIQKYDVEKSKEGKELTTNSKLYNSVFDFYHGIHTVESGVHKGQKIKRFFYDESKNKWTKVKIGNLNRGRVFEIYKRLIEEHYLHNYSKINSQNSGYYDELKEYFFEAQGENVKFFQQAGDVGNKELKNVSENDARLFAANTVVDRINDIIKALDLVNSDKEQAKMKLKKVFSVNSRFYKNEQYAYTNTIYSSINDLIDKFENF